MPSPTPSTTHRPVGGPVAAAPDPAVQPVEVRTRRADGVGPPEQILWRGRLWLVRHAEPLGGQAPPSERWTVVAGDGPAGQLRTFELVRLDTGSWQLHEDGAWA